MTIWQEIRKRLGSRRPNSHKGDYGRIFVVAGSSGMSGACVLTAQAALRSGAGLVTVGTVKSLTLVLARRLTEAMTRPLPETKAGTLSRAAFRPAFEFLKTQDVLAIGPGLSRNSQTQALIRKMVLASERPVLVDADGLNAFEGHPEWFRRARAPLVLTPHTGEFLRIFGGPKPTGDRQRISAAKESAKRYGVTVVLKGFHSVVASPDGETYVNETGNPGMATGGSGDVLSGIIAALMGHRGLDLFCAASFGVYLHGLAGDLAAKEKGQTSMIAGDMIGQLPRAFKTVIGQ